MRFPHLDYQKMHFPVSFHCGKIVDFKGYFPMDFRCPSWSSRNPATSQFTVPQHYPCSDIAFYTVPARPLLRRCGLQCPVPWTKSSIARATCTHVGKKHDFGYKTQSKSFVFLCFRALRVRNLFSGTLRVPKNILIFLTLCPPQKCATKNRGFCVSFLIRMAKRRGKLRFYFSELPLWNWNCSYAKCYCRAFEHLALLNAQMLW